MRRSSVVGSLVTVSTAVVFASVFASGAHAETCALCDRPPDAVSIPAPESTKYISVGADALPTVLDVASGGAARLFGNSAEAASDEVAVLALDDLDLEQLSEAMHERHGRCGGFIVHDSLADALSAAAPVVPLALERRTVDYSIDRDNAVTTVLGMIDAGDILQTIKKLSSYKNRYYLSESGATASAWLAGRWRGFSSRSDVRVEQFDQGYPQKSVILEIRGTSKPDEVVVIGGHLDSIAPGGRSSNAPGADDDASGIATLDHVAEVLLKSGFRPERTLQFIAYAAEEVGLRGSQAIVREYKRRGVNVVGVMQLDMTNYQGSDRDIWLIDDYTDREQNRFVAALIERYTTATWGVDRCGYACSDHASWHRVGVPASAPHETRSRDRNRHIHTARDTLEISGNNAAHAVKFAEVAAAYAIELAKGEIRGPLPERRCVTATSAAPTQAPGEDWWKLAGLLAAAAAMIAMTRRAG